jgi:hypothetical protein
VQFAIALHKHAIYPPGHPMLANAVDAVITRLDALLATRPLISLGVARKQLVIEGVATDPENPVLRELALRLHRQHVGAVKLSSGVSEREIGELLRALATDAERIEAGGGIPLGLDPQRRDGWSHARLFPLSYGQLSLLEESPEGEGEEASDKRARAASLWIGLARAALESDDGAEVTEETTPAVVARAIDAGSHEVAYDQVIVGYLLQIASEIQSGDRLEGEALRRRVSQLMREMRPDTLRRLLMMGGDAAQRRQFVLDATSSLTADVVVNVIEAAATAAGQTISHSLIRLLAKLATHAEQGGDTERVRASVELREQVERLVADWELEDPNPDAYREVLERMARAAPMLRGQDGSDEVEPGRLVAMSLELGSAGGRTWAAVNEMLARGEGALLLDLLRDASPDNPAAQAIGSHIASPVRVREVLAREPLDVPLLEWLAAQLGSIAAAPMLDALAAAERRATRWKLLTLLEGMGAGIAPDIIARLHGAPWYVQRNLLLLLAKLPVLVEGFSPTPYVRHSDPRVRREAVRMLFRVPGGRAHALRAALADGDAGVLQLGLAAAMEDCPPTLIPIIARHATNVTMEPHMRALALRVLGTTASRHALETLLQVTVPGRTLMGRPRLAPRSPELLTALSALAARWRDEPRAAAALALAGRSGDAEVRAAAGGTR